MVTRHQPRQKTRGLPPGLQEQLAHLLSAWPEIEKVILFGSRARGDAAKRADIDLAIVAPTATLRQWLDISFRLVEETNTLLPVDIVRWEEAPPSLREKILAEGKVLYERHKTEPKPE